MSVEIIIGIVLVALVVFIVSIVGLLIYKRIPKRLKKDKFVIEWKVLQSYCKDKKTWPKAIIDADKLLDKALKKRRYKGKQMGERMVAAQRVITNNDQMWFAHNLAKKLLADPSIKLRETDVKTALIGFRDALKDIGALQTAGSPVAAEKDEVTK